jgi:hypothetical protein
VLESGGFVVPGGVGRVATDDDPGAVVGLPGGEVRCHAYPVVVITGSGARDLAPELVRRCVGLRMRPPSVDALRAVVAGRYPADCPEGAPAADVVKAFLERAGRADGPVVERLLDALHLAGEGALDATTAGGRDTVWQWTAPEEP